MEDSTKQWLEDVNSENYIDRLIAGLKEKKMSQAEFARKCGCSPSRISALLRKVYAGITPKYIWETAKRNLDI